MANVKFSRKEIEKRVNLSPDILDRIMMLGVPVTAVSYLVNPSPVIARSAHIIASAIFVV